MLDERFGKVGTSERETFRKEAYNYCVGKFISDARKSENVSQAELAVRVIVFYSSTILTFFICGAISASLFSVGINSHEASLIFVILYLPATSGN